MPPGIRPAWLPRRALDQPCSILVLAPLTRLPRRVHWKSTQEACQPATQPSRDNGYLPGSVLTHPGQD
jgi:hypothetical protein